MNVPRGTFTKDCVVSISLMNGIGQVMHYLLERSHSFIARNVLSRVIGFATKCDGE